MKLDQMYLIIYFLNQNYPSKFSDKINIYKIKKREFNLIRLPYNKYKYS